MRVSIVIPLYNKANSIGRALDSVLAQTHTNFRVIVVDDGSTDDSASIVRRYTDSRIELICQSNLGPGAARNKGLFLSDDEYITFLDADDEWMPRFLEHTIALMQSYGKEVATVSCCLFYPPFVESSKQKWIKRGLREGIYHLNPKTPLHVMRSLITYPFPGTTLAWTSVLKECGGFYDKDRCLYGEDLYLRLKVALRYSFAISFEPLMKYHTEDSNLSNNLCDPYPIEPFLSDPGEIIDACPMELLPLLKRFLARKAYSKAMEMGFYGKRDVSKILLKDYHSLKYCLLPGYWKAHIYASPANNLVRKVIRVLRRKESI